MTIQLAYKQLLAQLYEVYDNREAANIADMVIEQVTGQKKIDRIVYKNIPVNPAQQIEIQKMAVELLQHRPVQYVLGESWFMGIKLKVNESVLIPRPETEELVEWIVEDLKIVPNQFRSLLDIGTGSGCIPLSIKNKIPSMTVSAIDVSEDALQVAKQNSEDRGIPVHLYHLNILDEKAWVRLDHYDIIVSNPPYITKREQRSMQENVLEYEPHLALFVSDQDPLIFYRAIAKFSSLHLKPGGFVYVEINEVMGDEVVDIFKTMGFAPVILKKDMQGKDRMVKAGYAL